MSITCPNCHLKGVVETQQLIASARVVCVRCKLTFDVDLRANLKPAASSAAVPVKAVAINEAGGSSLTKSLAVAPVAVDIADVVLPDESLPFVREEMKLRAMEAGLTSSPAGFALENNHARLHELAAPADNYGLGLRLLNVSPMWLLLSGLLFISFVVFCNWVTTPNAQAGVQGGGNDARRAANLRPTVNQATNQSVTGATQPH